MRATRPRSRGSVFGLALLAIVLLAPTPVRGAAERVVAVGDIHGAFDALVAILTQTGLIDERRDWIAGGTHFVQTGDFTDRGSRVRDVMELLIELERQAALGPGEVHLLLGNHEVMNLLGDDSNVLENPDIYASFADSGSEQRREAAYQAWVKWRDRRQATIDDLAERFEVELSADLARFLAKSREEWMETHPAGLFEYREAFAPDGRYGSWLRGLPVVVRVDDSLFLHGGISSEFEKSSIDQLNRLHWKKIKEWDKDRAKLAARGLILPYFSWVETRMALELQLRLPESESARNLARSAWNRIDKLMAEIGAEGSPLWFRGYSSPPRGLDDDALAELLDRTDRTHGVKRTVAAHTPIAGHKIQNRLDGRLFLIDTGMLRRYYGGTASALEITANGVETAYVERPPAVRIDIGEALPEPGWTRGGALRPQFAARASEGSQSHRLDAPARVYLGADGRPLPIQDLDALERYLAAAEVLSRVPVGQGTTGAERLLLELDGVRARAIFHTVDEKRGGPKNPVTLGDGSRFMYYSDSYSTHMATYKLSRLMGLDNVPPTVIRKIDGTEGSLTLWIEGGTNLTAWRERGQGDPTSAYFNRQIYDQRVFDNLIDNTDRNIGNIFWTGNFDLWYIDHTRSMARSIELYHPDRLTRCSRQMFEKIEALEPAATEPVLAPYLSKYEIKALFQRREKLLAKIRSNIEKLGEAKVLFNYGDPPLTTIVPEAA